MNVVCSNLRKYSLSLSTFSVKSQESKNNYLVFSPIRNLFLFGFQDISRTAGNIINSAYEYQTKEIHNGFRSSHCPLVRIPFRTVLIVFAWLIIIFPVLFSFFFGFVRNSLNCFLFNKLRLPLCFIYVCMFVCLCVFLPHFLVVLAVFLSLCVSLSLLLCLALP